VRIHPVPSAALLAGRTPISRSIAKLVIDILLLSYTKERKKEKKKERNHRIVKIAFIIARKEIM